MADQTATLKIRAENQTDAAFQQMRRSMASVERSTASLTSSLQRLGQYFGAFVGGRAILEFTKSIVDSADALSTQAQALGLTTEFLSQLQVQAKLSNTPVEDLGKAMQYLGYQATLVAQGVGQNAKYAFQTLGISVTDAAGHLKDTQQLWAEVVDKISAVGSATQQSAIVMELFGARAGASLVPMIQQLEQTRDAAKQMGYVIGTEVANNANRLNDNFALLDYAVKGFATRLFGELAPSLVASSNDMVEFARATVATNNAIEDTVRYLKYAGAAWTAFSTTISVGAKQLAAFAAVVTNLATGDFRGAFEAGKIAAEDMTARVREGVDQFNRLIGTVKPADAALQAWGADLLKVGEYAAHAGAQLKIVNAALEKQELKLYTSSLQGLEKELGAVSKQTKENLLVYEETKGSLASLTAEHKANLLVVAREIDTQTNQRAVLKAVADSYKQMEDAQSKLSDQQIEVYRATKQAADAMAFQASLIGKSADEQLKANAVHKIELGLQEQLHQAWITANGDIDAYMQQQDLLVANAKAEEKATTDAIDAQIAKQREWTTGAKQGWDEYVTKVRDSAAMAKQLVTDSLQGMEDVFVKFVQTGKLSFHDLVNSIIADLARIEWRKAVEQLAADIGPSSAGGGSSGGLGAIASSIGSWIFGKAGGGPVSAGAPYIVGEQGPELFVPSTSGTVVPNGQLNSGTVNLNVSIYAIDSQSFIQQAAKHRATFVDWTRQAFNARGVRTALG